MAILVSLCRSAILSAHSSSWTSPPICGLEAQHSCDTIFASVQFLIQKSVEWRGHCEVWVLSADVKAAFDEFRPSVFLQALSSWGVPAPLLASIARGCVDLQFTAQLFDTATPEPLPFTSPTRQGGVEAPFFWNATMRWLLALLCAAWRSKGLGLNLPMVGLSCLVWADNIYFFGSTFSDVQIMFAELTSALQAASLRWKETALELLAPSLLPGVA